MCSEMFTLPTLGTQEPARAYRSTILDLAYPLFPDSGSYAMAHFQNMRHMSATKRELKQSIHNIRKFCIGTAEIAFPTNTLQIKNILTLEHP